LFLYLLDCHSQHQNGHDSEQILSTHETHILCLLLKVLFSAADQTNVGFDMSEALLKALKVDGLSPKEPVALMPCLTVLQNLQPVLFKNLKTDTKEKVFGLLISMFRAENIEIRNATRDALLRINVHASTAVKFIELILAQGDKKGNLKRIKRAEKLNCDNHFEDYFGEKPVTSILVSLLDILFLMKDVNQR
jgi:U3 small nucleolar RNA-associated protein 10